MAVFPFTAIVGQERLKEALILNAVNPGIGGVLIRGEKGTAKSTLARALAELLPEIPVVDGCPFQCDPASPLGECQHCQSKSNPVLEKRRMRVVNLPANATEDRVAGTLDIEYAIKHGQRRFEPGILTEAHRGILYIDEVNLLDDHVVDLLLDAAAMGVNSVEREGISFTHPAQFILIGTMNPEEGDLRPQLLDRFGLCVDIEALMDVEQRKHIVRRRLNWERDQQAFSADFTEQQTSLAASIVQAREYLSKVAFDDARLEQAAQICVELDVRTHRADIVMARTAQTMAAFAGSNTVSEDDIKRAALLALPHRMRRQPFENSRLDEEQVEKALNPPEESEQEQDDLPDLPPPPPPAQPEDRVFEITEVPEIELPELEKQRNKHSSGGRQNKSTASAARGRYTRSTLPRGQVNGSDVAVDATLRAAAPHQKDRGNGGTLDIKKEDIRIKRREHDVSTLIMLVVDASGSMAAAERMAAAKGAVLNLLRDAYVKRSRVALLAFRDDRAEILLPPTDNVDLAHEQLKQLPTGGRTPLGHGLMKALELANQTRHRDPEALIMTVLVSDGKANVPYSDALQAPDTPYDEAVELARQLAQADLHFVVLDTEDDFLSLGLARKLADAARADYVRLSQIEADAIEQAVRERLT